MTQPAIEIPSHARKYSTAQILGVWNGYKNLVALQSDSNVEIAEDAKNALGKLTEKLDIIKCLHVFCTPLVLELHYFSLKMFSNLKELYLDMCPLSCIKDLYSLKDTLEVLSVINSGIPDLQLALAPVDAKLIRRLVPMSYISTSAKVPSELMWNSLSSLNLVNCGVTCMDQTMHFMPNIRSLDLSYNDITFVVNLQDCYQLSSITLSHNCIRVLSNLHRVLGNVLHLDLSFNQIESLDGLEKIHSLVSINLAHNQICDTNEISVLCELPNLEAIYLSGNTIAEQPGYRLHVFRAFLSNNAASRGTIITNSLALDGFVMSDEELFELRGQLFSTVEANEKELSSKLQMRVQEEIFAKTPEISIEQNSDGLRALSRVISGSNLEKSGSNHSDTLVDLLRRRDSDVVSSIDRRARMLSSTISSKNNDNEVNKSLVQYSKLAFLSNYLDVQHRNHAIPCVPSDVNIQEIRLCNGLFVSIANIIEGIPKPVPFEFPELKDVNFGSIEIVHGPSFASTSSQSMQVLRDIYDALHKDKDDSTNQNNTGVPSDTKDGIASKKHKNRKSHRLSKRSYSSVSAKSDSSDVAPRKLSDVSTIAAGDKTDQDLRFDGPFAVDLSISLNDSEIIELNDVLEGIVSRDIESECVLLEKASETTESISTNPIEENQWEAVLTNVLERESMVNAVVDNGHIAESKKENEYSLDTVNNQIEDSNIVSESNDSNLNCKPAFTAVINSKPVPLLYRGKPEYMNLSVMENLELYMNEQVFISSEGGNNSVVNLNYYYLKYPQDLNCGVIEEDIPYVMGCAPTIPPGLSKSLESDYSNFCSNFESEVVVLACRIDMVQLPTIYLQLSAAASVSMGKVRFARSNNDDVDGCEISLDCKKALENQLKQRLALNSYERNTSSVQPYVMVVTNLNVYFLFDETKRYSVLKGPENTEKLGPILRRIRRDKSRNSENSTVSVGSFGECTFADAPLFSVCKIHPLRDFRNYTLFFGYQRCGLEFVCSTGTGVEFTRGTAEEKSDLDFSTKKSSMVDAVIGNTYSYMIITREKPKTVEIMTKLYQLANTQRLLPSVSCVLPELLTNQKLFNMHSNLDRRVLSKVEIKNSEGALIDMVHVFVHNSKHLLVTSGGDELVDDGEVMYYQILYAVSASLPATVSLDSLALNYSENENLIARTFILTSSILFLCEEAFDSCEVLLNIMDQCCLVDISAVTVESNPLFVTISLKKQKNIFSARRKWTLFAPNKAIVEKLVNELKRLANL